MRALSPVRIINRGRHLCHVYSEIVSKATLAYFLALPLPVFALMVGYHDAGDISIFSYHGEQYLHDYKEHEAG